MNQYKERFTALIKKMRLDLELTQNEISDQLDMEQAQWSGYELGKNFPSIHALMGYLDKLEINKLNFFEILCSDVPLQKISSYYLVSKLKAPN